MKPKPYRWPAPYRSAAVFSVDVDAESPYLWGLRNTPSVVLSELEQRRFGPRQGVWRLMGLLAEFAVKGSFYVPGWVAQTYPTILPALVEQGHEVGAHGHYHERVDEIAEPVNARLLDRQIEVFRRQVGRGPVGYRSPAWELTPPVHALLRDRGFLYDSSLMGFDHPYSLDGLIEVPVEWLVDDSPYFRYLGAPSDKGRPSDPAAVLNAWREEFEATRDYGGLFMITVHDWISGRGQRVRMLRSLLAHIQRAGDTWVTTAEEIARHHQASENFSSFDRPLTLLETTLEL